MKNKSETFHTHEPEPLLIVISGPSGVGKDSVVRSMQDQGLPFHFVVTATTREIRENETDSVDYHFVSREQFAQMIEADELLEYAFVYNDYKGIPKLEVTQAFETGKDVVMRLDVQGAATIRDLCPEALLIFLTTQSEEELVKRLSSRKTEGGEGLELRIAMARKELKRIGEFDYVVVNAQDELERTVEAIKAIIKSEHLRVHHRKVTL